MDGTQIYQNFQSGDTGSLQSAADVIKQLSDGYKDEADAIKALQDRMNAAWTGSSGEAATAGANPLAQAFIDSAPPLDVTNQSMQEQSDVFNSSKAKVVEVPPAPSKPSAWSVGLKAAIPIVGPSMAAGDLQSYQDGVAATNAANENNVRVMQQYTAVTDGTRNVIPMDYKTLPIDGASVGLKPATPTAIGPGRVQYTDRATAAASSSTATSSVGTVDPVHSGPDLGGPSNVTSSGNSGSTHADPVRSGPNLPTGSTTNPSQFVPGGSGYNSVGEEPGTSRTNAPGRNTAAGRLYDAGGSGRGGPSDSADERLGRGPGESTGRGTSGTGGRGASASAGRSGAAGESAGRGGSVGESARSLGKGTGTGGIGSAAEEAAASRGAAGRGAASGSPVGAAGRRGEGEEDQQHRRPDYLIEPDPDAIFGTDLPATPPVIGE